ncbi:MULTISPECIES: GNAT family acetyltransferase [Streptomyces]|uniref:GNAT family acetyltransferase n=1 Tax=Streptomyces TaxID=1883 RepID=UPI001368F552|nr:GNAT family acetyltransferase [Streptomyces sp. SID2888]MYV45176.1 GNAT family acetyltransferase [Streptomyces sp. SID2888]
MTITITLPRIPGAAETERVLRRLLPVAKPLLLTVADAYGLGLPVRMLELGLKITRPTTQD